MSKDGVEEILSLPSRLQNLNSVGDKVEPTASLVKLLKACDTSPFGLNKSTVIDQSVRKALHIPASRVVINKL